MTYVRRDVLDDIDKLPRMPSWITRRGRETPEDAAFRSGAALAHLSFELAREEVPQALVRARLALRAAEACVTFAGRPERAGDLRDAVAFLQPGDRSGPAGDVSLSWRRAVERPISLRALQRTIADVEADQVARWLIGCNPPGAGQGTAVSRAAAVLQSVLADRPRDHTKALLLADAALAQALGWAHVVPLLALGLTRGDLRKTDGALRLVCHRAVVTAAVEAGREIADLTQRAARLRAVAPKLRAKGADEAVALFLSVDAIAPSALGALRSNRAARRFCDRLVELGAARELTGRDTFRLYGV